MVNITWNIHMFIQRNIICIYKIIHTFLTIKILMSVVMEHTIAPKHVQTLMEAIFVDVILGFYWGQMGLHAMVCAHVHTVKINGYFNRCLVTWVSILIIYSCISSIWSTLRSKECCSNLDTGVLVKEMIALKHVQTLLEASFVDVILVIHWMMMGLLVMVCRSCI